MSDEAPPQNQPRGSAWPIAIAVIAIAVVALAGFIFKSCIDQPTRLADTVARATQSQILINTVIQTSLERLRDESKLVVYTADVAVMITKFSDKKVLYGKLDLGTTTVRVRASGNKAQLVIDLKNLSEGDFRFDESENKLTIALPPPRVDETLVEVQTDPNFYEIQTELGWARLDKFSGEFLREQARRDLRPAVLLEAGNPHIIKAAEQSGREKITALMEAVIQPIRPETKIAVEFKEPDETERGVR
jgi:hypothetical protein